MKQLIIIATLYIGTLYTAPGCLDNSYHLTQAFDYKNYHLVQCNCPCEKQYKILSKRAQCSKCLHYRDPYVWDLLRTSNRLSIILQLQCLKKNALVGYPRALMKT